jgi:type IV pilus assembly protein PilE
MRASRGFTLMELMIVVVVIGVLASIAYPYYNDYITRSKIQEATSGLSDGRVKLEQFFQDNRTYLGGPAPTNTTYFNYSLSGASTTAYTLTATGKDSMTGYTFTIDQNNARQTTAAPAGWRSGGSIAVPASCWLTRKNTPC